MVAPRDPAPATVHLLPCEIEYTGPAPVSQYFKPKPAAKKGAAEGTMEACFRGRQLRGVEVKPPAGYSGAVLQDTVNASVGDGEQRKWLHKSSFDSFTYWKHGEAPVGDEPPFKAMRLAGLASALHHAPEDDVAPAKEQAANEVEGADKATGAGAVTGEAGESAAEADSAEVAEAAVPVAQPEPDAEPEVSAPR